MTMSKKKDKEKQIMAHAAGWKTPFDNRPVSLAREKVMARIAPLTMSQNTPQPTRAAEPMAIKTPPMRWAAAAAVIAMAVLAPYAAWLLGSVEVVQEAGGMSEITLPDGSTATLQPATTLQYNRLSWSFQRNVRLSGGASFAVRRGSRFDVQCQGGKVSVLGTQFAVSSRNTGLFVHCTEGQVEATTATGSHVLRAGAFVKFDAAGTMLAKGTHQNPSSSSGKGTQTFDAAPVALVAGWLEQITGKPLLVQLPPELTYTGTLNASNPELCLEIFCKSFGAQHTERNGVLVVYR